MDLAGGIDFFGCESEGVETLSLVVRAEGCVPKDSERDAGNTDGGAVFEFLEAFAEAAVSPAGC